MATLKQWIKSGFTTRQAQRLKALEDAAGSGTSSPSAAGEIVTANVPTGLEFAFWGYDSASNGLVIAMRVTVAPYDASWANFATDQTVAAGFDYAAVSSGPDAADYAALAVGNYVFVSTLRTQSAAQYDSNVATWGFDPRAFLPGAWQPLITA